MNKQQFEENIHPLVMVISVHPVNNKRIISFFDGYNNSDLKDKFSKDFPEYFTFTRLNKKAVKLRAKEMFNLIN